MWDYIPKVPLGDTDIDHVNYDGIELDTENRKLYEELKNKWWTIVDQCKIWVDIAFNNKNWKNVALYRGEKEKYPFIRTNKTTTHDIIETLNTVDLEIVDNWFKKNSFKVYRGNGIVVNGKQSFSKEIGHVFYFIPCDDFRFTWSTKIDSLSNTIYGPFGGLNEFNQTFTEKNKRIQFIEKILERSDYQQEHLYSAVSSNNEIIFSGSYWLIYKNKLTMQFLENNLKEDNEILKKYFEKNPPVPK